MSAALYSIPVGRADGTTSTLEEYRRRVLVIVNTASRCGLTPQYEQLKSLLRRYGSHGLSIVAFPCNQFNGQEPGTDAQIQEFCSMTYGVDFPVFAKIDVNGPERHPLYSLLVQAADDEGRSGDVDWNFEKFVVAPHAEMVHRVRPRVEPTDPAVTTLIEQSLRKIVEVVA